MHFLFAGWPPVCAALIGAGFLLWGSSAPVLAEYSGSGDRAVGDPGQSIVVAQSQSRKSRRTRASRKAQARAAATAIQKEQLDPVDAARYEAARNVCRAMLAGKPIEYTLAEAHERSPCVIAAPVRVTKIGSDAVRLKPGVLIDCRLAVALVEWVDRVVQPAARESFGLPVKEIVSASGYVCRPRNNQNSAKLSEHAFGKAIDISGFEIGGGRMVTVAADWKEPASVVASASSGKTPPSTTERSRPQEQVVRAGASPGRSASAKSTSKNERRAPSPAEGGPAAKPSQFLRAIHKGACGLFSTVLGPEADAFHQDHFHLDLSGRGSGAICE